MIWKEGRDADAPNPNEQVHTGMSKEQRISMINRTRANKGLPPVEVKNG